MTEESKVIPLEEQLKKDKISSSANSFKSLFKWGGIALLIFSVLNMYTLITKGFTTGRLLDFGTNLIYGVLWLYCYRLVTQRKAVVIWIYGALAFVSMTRSVFLGNIINILIVIAINLYLWFGLYNLKKKGELN